MKVLFCQPTLNRSGSEKSLLQMLRVLKDRKTISSIHVLAGEDGLMKPVLEPHAHVHVIEAPKLRRSIKGFGAFLTSFFTVYRCIKAHVVGHGKVVVYVNTLMFPQAAIAAFLNNVPLIVHIREVATTYPPGAYRLYAFVAAICASKLVAPCRYVFTQPQIPRFAATPKRRHVIYNAAAGHPNFLNRSLSQPFKILAVIPCTERKGIFDLVDCVQRLKQLLPHDARFQVDVVGRLESGHGSPYEEVRQRIREQDLERFIRFHGEVQEVDSFFLDAHVLLHPSHTECFPRVLVEAFGFSLPCVATNVGGVSELIVDGENGFLVPVRATKEMAESLALLLTDSAKYAKCARNAFQRFQEKHSLQQLGANSAKLIEMVADERYR
jgi:glycosyltransferase involved in cell wall biosynthesis